MSQRIEMLQRLTASAGADPFAWYALAMEYRKLGRTEEALGAFETLRERHAEYLPQYLMAGQVLVAAGRLGDARAWLSAGVALAERQGDGKALAELRAVLDDCGE